MILKMFVECRRVRCCGSVGLSVRYEEDRGGDEDVVELWFLGCMVMFVV